MQLLQLDKEESYQQRVNNWSRGHHIFSSIIYQFYKISCRVENLIKITKISTGNKWKEVKLNFGT